jgi:hypothetical protein
MESCDASTLFRLGYPSISVSPQTEILHFKGGDKLEV